MWFLKIKKKLLLYVIYNLYIHFLCIDLPQHKFYVNKADFKVVRAFDT